jgi:DNA-directed RNA polymerase subunit RPC12/RpoP
VKVRNLAEDDDLGLPWEKWADGMPHRLKRKRDFPDIDPDIVREAAKNAARRMGKAVQAQQDKMTRNGATKYVWVQFADYEVRIGEPCKCGSRRLLRVHPFFARCAACDARILLAPRRTDDSPDEDEWGEPLW